MRHSHVCSDALLPEPDPGPDNAPGVPANDPQFCTTTQPRACATTAPWPARGAVQRFEENAQWHGYRTAVLYAEQRLDYAALNQYANRLAWALQHLAEANGIATGWTDVAPCWLLNLEHSHHLLAAVIACLKIGHRFMLLDPHWPESQLRTGLLLANRESAPIATLSFGRHRLTLQSTGQRVIDLQGPFAHRWPLHNPELPLTRDTTACLIPATTTAAQPTATSAPPSSWQSLSQLACVNAVSDFEHEQQISSRSRRALPEHGYGYQFLIDSLATLSAGGSLTMALTDICAESLWPTSVNV